ncbi:MAG TPA: hypothetical protein VFC00_38175 [Micromonosporaceae bacterium]|nr:hypothetical protein [Micromonosporaceae bacterium]
MRDDATVLLQFLPADDAPREEDLLRRLGADVKDLRLGAVDYRYAPPDPDDPKAGVGPAEWLTVVLTAGRGLRDLVRVAFDWVKRAKHPIRVRIGDDELVVDNATDEQQKAIIEAFLARHSTD